MSHCLSHALDCVVCLSNGCVWARSQHGALACTQHDTDLDGLWSPILYPGQEARCTTDDKPQSDNLWDIRLGAWLVIIFAALAILWMMQFPVRRLLIKLQMGRTTRSIPPIERTTCLNYESNFEEILLEPSSVSIEQRLIDATSFI